MRYGGAFIFLVISSTLFLGALKNSPPNPQITSSSPDRRAQAQATVAALKQLARDPDSLKIEKLLISDDGKIQCIQYQAKNGFGGTNREFIVMINNETSKSLSDWTSNCLETFADYSAYVW